VAPRCTFHVYQQFAPFKRSITQHLYVLILDILQFKSHTLGGATIHNIAYLLHSKWFKFRHSEPSVGTITCLPTKWLYPSFLILPQNKPFSTAECKSMILFIHVTMKVCLNIHKSTVMIHCMVRFSYSYTVI